MKAAVAESVAERDDLDEEDTRDEDEEGKEELDIVAQ